jgi:hypothetical protein
VCFSYRWLPLAWLHTQELALLRRPTTHWVFPSLTDAVWCCSCSCVVQRQQEGAREGTAGSRMWACPLQAFVSAVYLLLG